MRHAFDVAGVAGFGTTGPGTSGFGAAGGWAPGISLETFARASHELRQPLSGILGEDDGPGIEAHRPARLFQPFYRAGGDAEQGTSGLGLSIVQALVLQMGGAVQVRSEPGQGARFTLRIPRVA